MPSLLQPKHTDKTSFVRRSLLNFWGLPKPYCLWKGNAEKQLSQWKSYFYSHWVRGQLELNSLIISLKLATRWMVFRFWIQKTSQMLLYTCLARLRTFKFTSSWSSQWENYSNAMRSTSLHLYIPFRMIKVKWFACKRNSLCCDVI